MPKVEHSLEIHYHSSSYIWGFDDPERFILTTHIEIVGNSETSGKPPVLIGKGTVTRVAVGRTLDAGESLFFVFDTEQELVDAGCAVFRPDFIDYRAAIAKQYPDAMFGGDFLLVRELQIFPEFRGQRLGLALMRQIVADLGTGCGLAVLNPSPFLSEVDRGGMGCVKLQKYWAMLGFRRVATSRFWAVDPAILSGPMELDLPTFILIDEAPETKFEGPNG